MNATTTQSLCECGCGQPTKLSDRTDAARGVVRGQPLRYVNGHCWRGRRRTEGPLWVMEDRGYDTPCWVWQRHISAAGYGYEQGVPAHRWVYEQRRGPIPEGLHLDHLCRQPRCVNPDHLEPVTNAENCRRGRRTKLTWADVEAIRASSDTNRIVAGLFGVDESQISRIRAGKVWT